MPPSNARLSVPNAQKIMWNRPWTGESWAAHPWGDGIGLCASIDCLRVMWHAENGVLVEMLGT